MVISEYDELVCSLHVLVRPDHHPYRVEWAKQLELSLPQSLLSDIRAIGDVSDSWLGLLGLSDTEMYEAYGTPAAVTGGNLVSGRLPCDVLTNKLRGLPDAEFLYILFNGQFDLSQIIIWLQGRDEEAARKQLSPGQRQALEKPRWMRRRVVEVLETYHTRVFRTEWGLIEPWLVRAERVFYEQLKDDPVQALNTLHPRLLAKQDAIYAQKSILHRWDYAQLARLVVRPSTFIEPHLLIGIHEMPAQHLKADKAGKERGVDTAFEEVVPSGDKWYVNDASYPNILLSVPLAVRVPGVSMSETVPADLVRMYKALSDGTRLKLMRSLFQHPHCTQQLAQIHGISEAAVSKHLKLLIESDFVTTERRGNYVFYQLKPEEMEMMIVYLRDFLEQ